MDYKRGKTIFLCHQGIKHLGCYEMKMTKLVGFSELLILHLSGDRKTFFQVFSNNLIFPLHLIEIAFRFLLKKKTLKITAAAPPIFKYSIKLVLFLLKITYLLPETGNIEWAYDISKILLDKK